MTINHRWIATRSLVDGNGHTAVQVSLSEAALTEKGHWRCVVRVDVQGEEPREGEALGVDAFQALMQGFERIHLELEELARRAPLTWLAPGDTGFARFMPTGLGLAFRRKVETLVEAEAQSFLAEAKARHLKAVPG